MNYHTAFSLLTSHGYDVEVESDGPEVFLYVHDKRGRLTMLKITQAVVSSSQVKSLLSKTA